MPYYVSISTNPTDEALSATYNNGHLMVVSVEDIVNREFTLANQGIPLGSGGLYSYIVTGNVNIGEGSSDGIYQGRGHCYGKFEPTGIPYESRYKRKTFGTRTGNIVTAAGEFSGSSGDIYTNYNSDGLAASQVKTVFPMWDVTIKEASGSAGDVEEFKISMSWYSGDGTTKESQSWVIANPSGGASTFGPASYCGGICGLYHRVESFATAGSSYSVYNSMGGVSNTIESIYVYYSDRDISTRI